MVLLLVLITLLNGTPLLAARMGWLDPVAYQRDYQAHCLPQGAPAGLVSACPSRITDPQQPGILQSLPSSRLHALEATWRWIKLPRLLLLLGVPLLSLWRIGLRRWPWPPCKRLLPALPLVASGLVSTLVTFSSSSGSVLLVSLLPLLWLLPLLAAGPFASHSHLQQWAKAALWLLVLQWPLLLLEAWRGLPMPFGPAVASTASVLPSRLVGSFIHPNSLGVAVLGLLGFCMAHSGLPRRPPLLFLLALPPLLLARSGTGLAGWLLLLLFELQRRWARLRWPGLVALVGVITALPVLLQRADLWRSPLGRLDALSTGMSAASPVQWLIGQGVHANSNQLLSLLGSQSVLHPTPSDGMPVLLLLQSGLIGFAAFYGLMLWAWLNDREARPFLLAVGLGSLTLNVVELFPLNLLLALSLHHSLINAGLEPAAPATLSTLASALRMDHPPQCAPDPSPPHGRSSASQLPGG